MLVAACGAAVEMLTHAGHRGVRVAARQLELDFGGLLVAAWLGGIIVSLLLVGGCGDIALRDFGLLVGALALSRLASANLTRGRAAA